MGYVLYGARGSGSGIVEAAVAELGVGVELRDLDFRAGEQRGEAYTAINPQRKVPALVVEGGDEVLTESVAIVLTLDEWHPDGGLLPPPGSGARARALRWMVFCAAELYPVVEILDFPERFVSGAGTEDAAGSAAAVRGAAVGLWKTRWQVLEDGLAGSPYALTEGFSALDLIITVMSRWDPTPEWRAADLPKVGRIVAAVRRRPQLAAVWARHLPGT